MSKIQAPAAEGVPSSTHETAADAAIDAPDRTRGPIGKEQDACADDDDPRSLPRLLARGSLWSLGGYAASQALRLIGNLILWRLLYPEAFGIMALVNVLMQGMAMFSDVGIGPSIVQNRRGEDPDYQNTAWTIQVVRGTLLFGVAVMLAAPVSRLYGEPQLARLLPFAALGFIIDGFVSTRLFTAARNMLLHRITLIELAAQSAALVGTVGWALVDRSIAALVAGALLANLTRVTLTHWALPGVANRFRWDRESAHTLLRFGRWVFLSTLLGFTATQADRLVFGKLVPMELLGVYSIALVWASLPNMILERIFRSVVFPALSRVYNAGNDFVAAFREAREPWLIFGAWVVSCLVAGGPSLIRLLYDERAIEAGWIVQLLALGTWVATMSSSRGNAALARGAPGWIAAASAAKVVALAALIPIGVSIAGFRGGVSGFVLAELAAYTVLLFSMSRRGLREFPRELGLTAILGAGAFAAWEAARKVHALLAPYAARGGVAQRVGAFAECTLVAVLTAALFGPLLLAHRAQRKRRPSALRG